MSLFLAACGFADSPKEKIIITVGSRNITSDELKRDLRRMTSDMELGGHEIQTVLKQLMEKLIDHYLILEYGRQEDIEVPDQDLEKVVREIQREYTEKDFQETLLKGVIDFDEWKEALRERLLMRKIVNRALEKMERVSLQEIKDYYHANQEAFMSPPGVRFRQIVTSTREEAEKALERLNSGEDMNSVIKEYVEAKGKEYGGEVGWVARGDLDESVEKVIFFLPVEAISPIVETPYGFHIFEVLERREEGVKGFTVAIPEIEAKLHQERQEIFIRDWVQSLRVVIPVKVDREKLKELELG
ncbi:MAG: peptidyl-prolyl cis-trans isomerase [Deltaproteobacteria bacterium]|nr:peptidyl-prolyl cis-trans isomerase [Deltaproteobacteria bacterium]